MRERSGISGRLDAGSGTGPGRTILVVEDDPSTRRTLCELIDGKGHATVAAASADDAVRALLANGLTPTLIVLGDGLSGADGRSLREWLGQDARLGRVPLLPIPRPLEPETFLDEVLACLRGASR